MSFHRFELFFPLGSKVSAFGSWGSFWIFLGSSFAQVSTFWVSRFGVTFWGHLGLSSALAPLASCYFGSWKPFLPRWRAGTRVEAVASAQLRRCFSPVLKGDRPAQLLSAFAVSRGFAVPLLRFDSLRSWRKVVCGLYARPGSPLADRAKHPIRDPGKLQNKDVQGGLSREPAQLEFTIEATRAFQGWTKCLV